MTLTALVDSSSFLYMRRLPAQNFSENSGIISYEEILKKSRSYTYLFQVIKYLQDINVYKFCQGWDRKPVGEKETLLKRFTQRSLIKVHLSVVVLGVRMYLEIIRRTRAKVEFCFRFKK